jgi:hypothetical protein
MMTLYEKIKQLYPSLTDKDFMTVITLQNDSDGKGDYIAKWEHPTLPRPTDDVLYENTNLTSLNRELA